MGKFWVEYIVVGGDFGIVGNGHIIATSSDGHLDESAIKAIKRDIFCKQILVKSVKKHNLTEGCICLTSIIPLATEVVYGV